MGGSDSRHRSGGAALLGKEWRQATRDARDGRRSRNADAMESRLSSAQHGSRYVVPDHRRRSFWSAAVSFYFRAESSVQILIVRSRLPEAINAPLGDNAIAETVMV